MEGERTDDEGRRDQRMARRRRRSKRRSWLAKVARYTLRSADARHECKRGHYARVREVKRFTTPVACGLGQIHKRERERGTVGKKDQERKLAPRERRQKSDQRRGGKGNEER